MIGKLKASLIKNFHLMMRSRLSMFIIVITPLLLILFLGMGVRSQTNHVTVGYYSLSGSEDFTSLLNDMYNVSESQSFRYVKYDELGECKSDVQKGRIHVCISYIENEIGNPTVHIFVDEARSRIAYSLLGEFSEQFSERSQEIGADIMRDIIAQMITASRQMKNQQVPLSTLKDKIARASVEVREIKSGLATLTFDLSAVSLDQDENFKDMQNSIDRYDLKSQRAFSEAYSDSQNALIDVRNKKAELYVKRAERDRNLEELQQIYNENDCDNKPKVLLDENNYNAANIPEDPSCSVLYSLIVRYRYETRDIDSTIATLEEVEMKLISTQGKLDNYKQEVEQSLERADDQLETAAANYERVKGNLVILRDKIDEFNEYKTKASTSLTQMTSVMNESSLVIGNMLGVMTNMSRDFSKFNASDAEMIIDPLQSDASVINAARTKLEGLFESILALILGFTCTLLASLLIVREKNSKAFFRNAVLGLPTYVTFSSAVLTVTIIGMIQSAVIILLGKYAFGLRGLDNFPLLMLVIFAGGILFSTLGILIGSMLIEEENVVLTALMTTIILFLFSGVFIPTENFSEVAYQLSSANPFVLVESSLKYITIYEQSVVSFAPLSYYVLEVALFLGVAYIFLHRFRNSKK